VEADIRPYLKGRVFDGNTTRVMSQAFDKARRMLHDRGQPHLVQELIAKEIIALASAGQRDSSELARQALKALGLPVSDDG